MNAGVNIHTAILGGSFNPITFAHTQIAVHVFAQVNVSDIVLMPCYSHLQKTGLADFGHRFNMCQIACEKLGDWISVSNFEACHEMDGSVYTLMTELKKEYKNVDFSYIIGMDQANNFKTWKNWQELKDMVRFIVIPRVGVEPDPNVTWYLNPPHIYLSDDFPIMEASSTRVRELLKQPTRENETLNKMLNKDVFSYICDEELYQ